MGTQSTSSDIHEIKERVKVWDVVRRWYHADIPDRVGLYRSPWRDDENPSFSIFIDGKVWKDHSTGESGDVISLLTRDGKTFREAVSILGSWCDIKQVRFERREQKKIELAALPQTPPEYKKLAAKVRKDAQTWKETNNVLRQLVARKRWDPKLMDELIRRGCVGLENGKIAWLFQRGIKLRGSAFISREDRWLCGGSKNCLFLDAIFNPRSNLVFMTEGECLTPDTEILTEDGWIAISEYVDSQSQTKVAQWAFDGSVSWVHPISRFKGQSQEWLHFSHHQIDQMVTPNHKMVYYDHKGRPGSKQASEWNPSPSRIPKCGKLDGVGIDLSEDQIILCLAVSADSVIDQRKRSESRYARFSLLKERKVNRLVSTLERLGIKYSRSTIKCGHQSICFTLPDWVPGRMLPWSWVRDCSLKQRDFVISELVHWDGNSVPNRNQTEFTSKYLVNAEWAQAMCVTSGRASTIIKKTNRFGTVFKASMLHGKNTCSYQRKPTRCEFQSDSYCLTVPSGCLLIRRNRIVSVTGNSDAITILFSGMCRKGRASVLGVSGASVKPHPDLLKPMIHGKTVVLVGDNDKAGRGFIKRMTEHISLQGVIPKHLVWGSMPYNDISDFSAAEGGSAVADYISNSHNWDVWRKS